MEVVRKIEALQSAGAALRRRFGSLALVPTMGALHDGHRALVTAAATGGAAVVVSIFVNPLQFNANEDLSLYPRDEAGDLAALRACGCHLVWLPDVKTMYPPVVQQRSMSQDRRSSGKVQHALVISVASQQSAQSCSARCTLIARISAKRTGSSCRWCAE